MPPLSKCHGTFPQEYCFKVISRRNRGTRGETQHAHQAVDSLKEKKDVGLGMDRKLLKESLYRQYEPGGHLSALEVTRDIQETYDNSTGATQFPIKTAREGSGNGGLVGVVDANNTTEGED